MADKATLASTLVTQLREQIKSLQEQLSKVSSQQSFYEKNWRSLLAKHIDDATLRIEAKISRAEALERKVSGTLIEYHSPDASKNDRTLSEHHLEGCLKLLEEALADGTQKAQPFDPFGDKQIAALQRKVTQLKAAVNKENKAPSGLSKSAQSMTLQAVLKENNELKDTIAELKMKGVQREQVMQSLVREMRRNEEDTERLEADRVTEMYEAKQQWLLKHDQDQQAEREVARREIQALKNTVAQLRKEKDDMFEQERSARLQREYQFASTKDEEFGRLIDQEREKQRAQLKKRDLEVTELRQQVTKLDANKSELQQQQLELEDQVRAANVRAREHESAASTWSRKQADYERELTSLKEWNRNEALRIKTWQDQYTQEKENSESNLRTQFTLKVAAGVAKVVRANFRHIQQVSNILASGGSATNVDLNTTQRNSLDTIRNSIFNTSLNTTANASVSTSIFQNNNRSFDFTPTHSGQASPRVPTSSDMFNSMNLTLPVEQDSVQFGGLYDSIVLDNTLSSSGDAKALLQNVTSELYSLLSDNTKAASGFVVNYQEALKKQSLRYKSMLLKMKNSQADKVASWSEKHRELSMQLHKERERMTSQDDHVRRLKETLEIKTEQLSTRLAGLEQEKKEYQRMHMNHLALKTQMEDQHARMKTRMEIQYKEQLDELVESHDDDISKLNIILKQAHAQLKDKEREHEQELKSLEEKMSRRLTSLHQTLDDEKRHGEVLQVEKYALQRDLKLLRNAGEQEALDNQRAQYQGQRRVDDLTAKLTALEQERDDLQVAIEKQQASIQELRAALGEEREASKMLKEEGKAREQALQADVASAQQALADLEHTIEKERHAKQEIINNLELAANENTRKHEETKSTVCELENALQKQEDELTRITALMTKQEHAFKSEIKELSVTAQQSNERCGVAQQKCVALEESLKDMLRIHSKQEAELNAQLDQERNRLPFKVSFNICGHEGMDQRHADEIKALEEKHAVMSWQMQRKIVSLNEVISEKEDEVAKQGRVLDETLEESSSLRAEFQQKLEAFMEEERTKREAVASSAPASTELTADANDGKSADAMITSQEDEEPPHHHDHAKSEHKPNMHNAVAKANEREDEVLRLHHTIDHLKDQLEKEKTKHHPKKANAKAVDKKNKENESVAVEKDMKQPKESQQSTRFPNPFIVIGPTPSTVQISATGMLQLKKPREVAVAAPSGPASNVRLLDHRRVGFVPSHPSYPRGVEDEPPVLDRTMMDD